MARRAEQMLNLILQNFQKTLEQQPLTNKKQLGIQGFLANKALANEVNICINRNCNHNNFSGSSESRPDSHVSSFSYPACWVPYSVFGV